MTIHHQTGCNQILKTNALCLLLLIMLSGLTASPSRADAFTTRAMITPRIVGGETASADQFVWQASIFRNPESIYLTQFCAGSILSERWIITAAHCVIDERASGLFVGVGFIDLDTTAATLENDGTGQVIAVERIITHPDYIANSSESDTGGGLVSFDSDIALLELSTAIDFDLCGDGCDIIRPVSSCSDLTADDPGAATYVSGWGSTVATSDTSTSEQNFPEDLLWTELDIMTCISSSTDWTQDRITDNMLCAGVTGFCKDSCAGDSGGPLVVRSTTSDEYLLAGIVSFGIGCAEDRFPGVYTRLTQYETWIEDNTGINSCAVSPATTPVTLPETAACVVESQITGDSGGGGSLQIKLFWFMLTGFLIRLISANRYINKQQGSNSKMSSKQTPLKKRPSRIITPVIMLFFLSGCMAEPDPTSRNMEEKPIEAVANQTTQPMPFGHWQLQIISKAGETTSVPEHLTFTLHLTENGAASGKIYCNRWQGTSLIKQNTLSISSQGSTRRSCGKKVSALASDLQRNFIAKLAGPAPYLLNNEKLELSISEQDPSERWIFKPLQQQ